VWLTLFATIVGEVLAIFVGLWTLIWLIIAVPRLVRHQRLTGAGHAAWEVSMPIAGLVSIYVIWRALFAYWMG
jgi:hypothetical protein